MQDGIRVSDFYRLQEAVRNLDGRVTELGARVTDGERRIETRLDRFEEKMDAFISQGSLGRRNEWGLAVQIFSFGVMALISISSLIVTVLRIGRP